MDISMDTMMDRTRDMMRIWTGPNDRTLYGHVKPSLKEKLFLAAVKVMLTASISFTVVNVAAAL